MSTLTVMTRLQLNWQEVPGIVRAFLFEPSQGIEIGDLPAVYPVTIGRMTQPAPGQSATPQIPLSAGQYAVARQYVYRVLLTQSTSASVDSGDLGAYIDEVGVTFIDNPIDYFVQHPRLNTAMLGDLPQLVTDLTIQDSGLVVRSDPSGTPFLATDYTINLIERRIPAWKRIS